MEVLWVRCMLSGWSLIFYITNLCLCLYPPKLLFIPTLRSTFFPFTTTICSYHVRDTSSLHLPLLLAHTTDITSTSHTTSLSPHSFAYPVTLFTHITANDVHNRVSLAADAMLPEIPAYFSSLPTPHVIMLSGPPASGRTTLSEYFFPDHVQINSNTKRSGRDPLAELTPHITAGKNIVVDRLHHRIDDRNKVTDACRKLNVPLYGVAVTAPLQACYAVRTVCNQSSRGNIELVPNMAYLDYQLFYKAPSIEEGFKDIISTPW